MNLKTKIKNFPNAPGVYFWLGLKKEILYIGRATSLQKRTAQYFRSDLDQRIAEMVGQARNIKYKKTATLLEAVILEANLIKKYWPKYNVKDRDDRSFVYAVIPQADFPRPLIVRERELNKFPVARNKFFGPYQSQALITNALRLIRRVFPYSTCRPHQGQPCFDYQIGLCPGACVDKISQKDYQKNIKNIILLLSGQQKRLMNKLKKENPEQAAALRHLQDVSLITRDEVAGGKINRLEAYDVSHLSGQETYGAMVVFSGGRPDKTQYRLFEIKTAPESDDLKALAEMVIRRFGHEEWPRPDLILLDGGRPQVDYIVRTLKFIKINIPLVGISKLGGDKLVFPAGAKKSFQILAEGVKNTLLQARDEAHRFSNRARKKRMKNIVIPTKLRP